MPHIKLNLFQINKRNFHTRVGLVGLKWQQSTFTLSLPYLPFWSSVPLFSLQSVATTASRTLAILYGSRGKFCCVIKSTNMINIYIQLCLYKLFINVLLFQCRRNCTVHSDAYDDRNNSCGLCLCPFNSGRRNNVDGRRLVHHKTNIFKDVP